MHSKLLLNIALWVGLALALIFQPAQANPWVEADDIYLRASIQQLADRGFLRGNVTTYPLMWGGIARDLREVDTGLLTESELYAYYRVRSALQFAQRPSANSLRVQASTARGAADRRFNSFGDSVQESGSLRASRSFIGEGVAARVQTTLRADALDDKNYVFEGSYLATTLGNWGFSIDQMPVWWGPGVDNALVLSTNSKPIQAFRLNRLNDNPIPVGGLRALGPANLTAFIGRTQSSASLGDQQVSGARLTLRPHSRLTVGVSHLTHWESFDDWYNRMLGVDARVSFGQYIAGYTEIATNNSDKDDLAFTLGVELKLGDHTRQKQIFAEYSDIPADFYQRSAYHGNYIEPDGYRRWQQAIGASQDQDVRVAMLGMRTQDGSGRGWQLKARYAEYGDTNLPMQLTHNLQLGESAERTEVSGYYLHPWRDALITLGATLYRDKVSSNMTFDTSPSAVESNSKTGVNIHASWEFRF